MRLRTIALVFLLVAAGCRTRRARAPKIPSMGDRQTGVASWYGQPYHGRRAANGEIYDMEKLTAAHRNYAFDTWLLVRNLTNQREVTVRVTDRGPFVDGRIIDLSRAAAREIDMLGPGTAKVRLTVVRAPKQDGKLDGSSTAKASERPLLLQAGAFSNEDNARQHAERLRGLGAGAIVRYDEKRNLWRVFAAEFERAAESEELASRLRKEGIETFVVEHKSLE